MPDFYFHIDPAVWFGSDALLRLPLLAADLAGSGRSRALLVADPLLYESKAIDRIRGLLEEREIQVLVFDEIPERATSRTAEDALRLARGARAPLVKRIAGI
ncbi:MAG: iron-containing alcohol dehydrogenase, partial [Treponema sp.]|nr:iron-containing alcohol dehydrogenase [Treponema sp.]